MSSKNKSEIKIFPNADVKKTYFQIILLAENLLSADPKGKSKECLLDTRK
jgi:hypothetical protein